MRRNPRDSGRNASAPEWIAFFDHAAESHPEVLFVVIGTREEVLPELTGRENLVFAKLEAESTLLQDLALIEACEAFVGHNSGVAFFSWVLGKPSLVFGTDRRHLHFGHAVAPGGRYNFLTDRQRLLWGPYGAEDIIGHFQEVVLRS
jgi:ADP-heptose:LPS heptosyltransferase